MGKYEEYLRKAGRIVNMQSLVCISWSTAIVFCSSITGMPSLHVLCLFHFYLSISANLVSDPCSLEACDHIFCRYVCERLYFMSGELC